MKENEEMEERLLATKNGLKKDIRCIYISIIKQASMNGIL